MAKDMERIYVVEDDDNIRNLVEIALKGYGYQVEAFETAEECFAVVKEQLPDVFVFDWMLPGMDGISAIKQLRSNVETQDIPILVLTAKDKEIDKVIGLDEGADDYMTKPFGIMEFTARIRSLLRRVKPKENGKKQIPNSNISINKETREVYCKGELVELTYKEFELLSYLMENSNRIVERDELLNRIWGYDYDGETRTLDMHIRTLRQKLGEEGSESIKTVRGVGYRFIRMEEKH